ncbi:RRQRL motif-containing zinc-binding protein [Streptomyces hayashii]|uniref:RRQRL motif-containing zinc-binding protein n=1 Tax=Streptomyces hayashii TaxID=2839966 RepID=UPI00403C5120
MTRLALADCFDPTGERFGVPTYPWRCAPDDLATRRQLRRRGLRPGGQDIAGQILRPRRRREPLTAYLYRIDLAKPVRPMTAGRWRAHEAMMRPRRTCPVCRRDVGYVIRTSIGTCEPCDPTLPAADQRQPALRSS